MSTSAYDSLLGYIQQQTQDPPALPGVSTWADFADRLAQVPRDEVEYRLAEVQRSFVVDITDQQYERWTRKKRWLANQAAADALRQAQAQGHASDEQRRAMLAYTGLGGLTDIGVLPPEYPPEYVEASRAWAGRGMTGYVPAHQAMIMERVRDQYYTPMASATALWNLVQRAAPSAKTVLEPSAGMGRLVRTAPAGLQWTLVELDAMVAAMLSFVFPQARVYQGYFEEAHLRIPQDQQFDLVVGNPPYGPRGPEGKALDMDAVGKNEDYFILRAGSRLRPGGTLAYLINGSWLWTQSHAAVRERVVREFVLRGAALLPSGVYPNVRQMTFTIMLWTRRYKPLTGRLPEREANIVQGKYLSTEEGRAAICGGTWQKGRGVGGREQLYLFGEPDYGQVSRLWLAPPPEVPEGYAPKAPKTPKAPKVVAPKPTTKALVLSDADMERTEALAARAKEFALNVSRDPEKAEKQRLALRNDIVLYLADVGNPHPKGPAALRALVTEDGMPEAILDRDANADIDTRPGPPEDATFAQTVSWWSEVAGQVTAADLGRTDEDMLEEAYNEPEVCVELRPTGLVYMAKWAYLIGSPAGRLVAIDNAMGTAAGSFADKLRQQKELVLSLWTSTKVLAQIEADPRSTFVPLQAVAAWIASKDYPEHVISHGEPNFTVEDTRIILDPEGLGRWVNGAAKEASDILQWFIPYFNRDSKVEDLEGSGRTKTGRVGTGEGAKAQAVIDEKMVNDFQTWLANSPWGVTVEVEYNEKFGFFNDRDETGFSMSGVPTTPLPLAGQNPQVRLHAHQNQAIRRASLGNRARPLLVAHDVGAGKTFTGIATAMRWRQIGACRRVIITVPPSVLMKWYVDSRRLFPEAQIGVIGTSETKKGKDRPDTPDVRQEKWLRFASGQYDFVLVGLSTFVNDLEPDVDEVGDLVSTLVWARRGAADKVNDIENARRRLRSWQDFLTEVEKMAAVIKARSSESSQGYVSWSEQNAYNAMIRPDTGKPVGKTKDFNNRVRTELLEARRQVSSLLAKLGEMASALGTENETADVQRVIRATLMDKPYRPRLKGKRGEDDDEALDDGPSIPGGEEDEEEESALTADTKKGKTKGPPLPGLFSWGDLKVDGLIVDEAHRMKNQWYPAMKIDNAGKGQDELFGVVSAWDMWLKSASVNHRHGGEGGVMFLSATPISNSPLELYTLLSMVSPRLFPNVGINDKEQFIDRYWQVQTEDTPRPSGELLPAPALKGFKNLDELNGIIGSVLDRRSTAELVRRGWLKEQPEPLPVIDAIPRDPAQTALVRSLVSIYRVWTKKKKQRERDEGDLAEAVPGVLDDVPTNLWTLNPKTGELIDQGPLSDDTRPAEMSGDQAFKGKSIFVLVWQALLDKVPIDPRLITDYADALGEGSNSERKIVEAYLEWLDRKTTDPDAPRPKKLDNRNAVGMIQKLAIAQAVLALLPMDAVTKYYEYHPDIPKYRDLAFYVSKRKTSSVGFCGHVIFCDRNPLHLPIKDYLVKYAGIRPERIFIMDGKVKVPDRLKASQAFNGRDAQYDPVTGELKESEIVPIYDVMIGNSGTMAEGMDLQRRTCSVHHLDLDWKPSVLQQRNGRAVRQGNKTGSVDIIYYLTGKTFDGFRFALTSAKSKWFEEFFSGVSKISNPSASEVGSSTDMTEVILDMVIEDEQELARRKAAYRAARDERLRAERLKSAIRTWGLINAEWARVRRAPDPERREAYRRMAKTRTDRYAIDHPDYANARALKAVEFSPVFLQVGDVAEDGTPGPAEAWVAGDCFVPVSRWGKGAKHKVIEVVGRDYNVLSVRQIGHLGVQATDRPGERVDPWTWEDEATAFKAEFPYPRFSNMAESFAKMPKDLAPRATELWKLRPMAEGYTRYDRDMPFFEMRDGTLLWPSEVPFRKITGNESSYGRDDISTDLQRLLTSSEVVRVYPYSDPELWTAWLRALRTDTAVVGSPVGSGRVTVPLREGTQALLRSFTLSRLNRALPGDIGPRRKAIIQGYANATDPNWTPPAEVEDPVLPLSAVAEEE